VGKVRTAVGLHSVTIATINPHTHLNPVCTVLLVTAHAVYGPTSRHTRASCRRGCCHLPPSAGFSLAYTCHQLTMTLCRRQWRRQDFVTGGGREVRYGSIGDLEYEVPQSRLYCLCINVALCSTALQCICRVIRRSPVTTKAHTYYIIFGRSPIGGTLPPSPPLAAPLLLARLYLPSAHDDAIYRCQSEVQSHR